MAGEGGQEVLFFFHICVAEEKNHKGKKSLTSRGGQAAEIHYLSEFLV